MKRWLLLFFVMAMLAAPVIVLASDVSEALYYGNIHVSNNGTAVSGVSTNMSLSSASLIATYGVDNAFDYVAIKDSGTGYDVPFMPSANASYPWCLWVDSIAANSNLNYTIYTGQSSLNATKYYFPGVNGMTVSNNMTEPGSNFKFTINNAGINTSALPNGIPLIYKESAFNIVNNPTGNLTAGIVSAETYALTHTANGTYCDINVSAMVPPTAKGVLLEVMSTSGTPRLCGFRKNGSNDDRYLYMTHTWVMIGIDANKIFQVKEVAGGDLQIYLRAYFYGSGIEFNTNATDISLTAVTAWTDIDLSIGDKVPVGTVGVIVEVINSTTAYDVGLRKNGSTDARISEIPISHHFFAIIGLDSSLILEGYIENTAVDFFLVGYITSGAVFNTNAYNKSLSASGAWTDITGLPVNVWAIFEVTITVTYDYGFRRNGTIEDRYQEPDSLRAWAVAPTDSMGIVEAKISTKSATDFYQVGYLESSIIMMTYPTYTYSCSVTEAVPTGEHDIVVSATGGGTDLLSMAIDGGTPATTALVGSVPINSAVWAFAQGTMYVESISYEKSGTPVSAWRWEYGTIFHDSVGANHGTPSFRTVSSDADVKATLITFQPVEQAAAEYSLGLDWPTMITSGPDQPGTMYSEGTPGIFFAPLVNTFWSLSGVPVSFFWYNFTFAIIIMAGILVFRLNQSLLLKTIVMATIMVLWALPGPNVYGMYVVIYFCLYSAGLLILSRSYGW